MYGKGLLKGLSVTFNRFFQSYMEDIRWLVKRYPKVEFRSSSESRGTFTVEYPEQSVIIPEEFRFVPFLVYDEGEQGEKNIRCTSCGICAKACPPQCIWIVRSTDPDTGRPVPQPAEFYIDFDICMNCGMCAEFCPFDAIKMDHNFEISSYTRNLANKEQLMKPASYYESIRPENYKREEEAREAKAAAKAASKTL
ncbi:MAG TPA: 4Fe-4S binding protein [Anaerolineales bacterium]|nr:4Fe-4S binding protein [Anaerolineales bacterium]